MNYTAIKDIHIACVVLSGSLFLLRGIWALRESAMLRQRWVKVVPHIIDTLLLASALTLVVRSGQYPFVPDWLTAKVLALILYIILGNVALKRGKTRTVRFRAFIGALVVFGYMVGVAVTRRVMVFA